MIEQRANFKKQNVCVAVRFYIKYAEGHMHFGFCSLIFAL